MPIYEVECQGEVREVYIVEAPDEETAIRDWHTGRLKISEASSVESVSAQKVED